MAAFKRITGTVAAVILLSVGVTSANPASAQQGSQEVRLETAGQVTAVFSHNGNSAIVPTNTEHPYGWSGDGTFVLTTGADGSCRIIVDGVQVSTSVAGGQCRWP